MSAGVVDHLESIEVEITQRVLGVFDARGIQHALQALLELATINEPRERIVAGPIGQLVGKNMRIGNVLHDAH